MLQEVEDEVLEDRPGAGRETGDAHVCILPLDIALACVVIVKNWNNATLHGFNKTCSLLVFHKANL